MTEIKTQIFNQLNDQEKAADRVVHYLENNFWLILIDPENIEDETKTLHRLNVLGLRYQVIHHYCKGSKVAGLLLLDDCFTVKQMNYLRKISKSQPTTILNIDGNIEVIGNNSKTVDNVEFKQIVVTLNKKVFVRDYYSIMVDGYMFYFNFFTK